MDYKKLLCLALLILSLNQSFSQADELKGHIQKLQGMLATVTTGSKTYDQEIKPLEYGGLVYSATETDTKGVKTVYGYEFNLADIDPYAVRQETQKDVILVSMTVRNKQKLAKVYKNGAAQSYDETIQMRAKDIDNARELTEIIKKCIPLAEKLMAGKLKLSGYDAMATWLVGNIKNVDLGDKSLKQTLAKGEYVGSFVLTQTETDTKGSREEQYVFNLADINLSTLTFKVSGNKFALNFDMLQKLRSVSFFKDGKRQPFVGDISIVTNNVDEARDIKTVLGLVVPLAVDKVKADNPKASSQAEALQATKNFIKTIKTDAKEQTQSLEGQCVATYTYTAQTANSTEKHAITFNFMDLNPNLTKIEARGDKMSLEALTIDKQPVVMHYKNDKLEGYDREVNFFVENIEIGRRLKFAVDNAIEKCKASNKDPFGPTAKDAFNWLKSNLGEVVLEGNSVKQSFDASGSDNLNKVKLTSITVKGNSSAEEVIEFNFSDINPTTLEVSVKGKWLYVKFETNYKSKIIGAYKDGKIQPYTSSAEIAVKDIETARGVIAAFKKCIDAYKAK
jgi:hypothetical protein